MSAPVSAHYCETALDIAEGPLALACRLARSGAFSDYMVYENQGIWSFAAGRLAELRLSPAGMELTCGPLVRHLPLAEGLPGVGSLLAGLPLRGWRAYGWARFELADVLSGATLPEDSGDLLFLMVPASEVRITDGRVLLRASDEERLKHLAGLVRSDPGPPALTEARLTLNAEDHGNYRAAVATAVAAIEAGHLEKVVLSREVTVPYTVDLAASYYAGRHHNTPARSFLLDLGGLRAAGFSPETILEATGDGQVTTTPLAGTRARTGSPHADARLRADLLSDPKEIHEHAISVRLACDELASVCGTVHVRDFMTVQERGSVQHLASAVSGRLRSGHGPWHALAAVFPAVTATGIPKQTARNLIREVELTPRGLYAGAVLTCDDDGALDAALVLRTIYQDTDRTWLRAGAGVVRHSRPEREHEETCEKLNSVTRHLVPGE
ncbi:salicylate synthase [Streptomyces sp. 769]|uniref:salicylate synthase n=1 Tax=Streptomyces sp. 769 TaxID=1262452 RepID=UPI0005806A84|nr:salicylate synthase [Streptomyces sp. 769]AJC53590.1 Isochorismate synthase [Streptomyces sp. 769]